MSPRTQSEYTRRDGGRRDALLQQVGHPLLEQGGFADLPASTQRVNTGGLGRQPRQHARPVLVGLALQEAQLRIARAEVGGMG
jgi:hypothetical protein